MYFVYLLKLSDGKVYTGSTPNLKERVDEHQFGKCESTKKFRPVELIWFCAFRDRLQARRFEDYLKTGSGQAFRNKRLIEIPALPPRPNSSMETSQEALTIHSRR